jgi:hypothetical protein
MFLRRNDSDRRRRFSVRVKMKAARAPLVAAGGKHLVNASFSAYQWLQLLALGGFAGALGQGIRAIVGLKKLHDAASGANVKVADLVSGSQLLVSLAIGFIAGALAAASTISNLAAVTGQQIVALAAAGYAGADFIEGFMRRATPSPTVGAGQEGVGVAGAAPAAGGGGADGAAG